MVSKVKDLMAAYPVMIDSGATLAEAAVLMADIDCGFLPVGTKDRLEGVITDRDIVIRAIALHKNPARSYVGDHMTAKVCACNEDDLLEDAADKMRVSRVSRLVVRNHTGKVTGVLSFGNILRREADPQEVTNVIKHAVQAENF